MISYTKILTLFSISTLHGCGSLGNAIIGPEQEFKNFADSWLGKTVDQAALPRGCASAGKAGVLTRLDDMHAEQAFHYTCVVLSTAQSTNCHWAVTFEHSTRKVVSWRYISLPSECKRDSFYQGAW